MTNTPRPTATPDLSKDVYLELGTKGKKVETLQRRLIELGWLEGSVTGRYDEVTEAAVSAFQKKAKLWVDGKAGPDTLKNCIPPVRRGARIRLPASGNAGAWQ